MVFISILKLLTAVLAFSTAYGCTCFKSHLQQQFCTASYVIRGKVLGKNTPVTVPPVSPQELGSVLYKVKVLDVLKDETNTISFGDIITLETAASGGVCGVNLENTEYLLGGRTPSGIGLCDIVTKWNEVTRCQKTMLTNKHFKYDCRCEIEICDGDTTCKPSIKACKMAFNGEAEQDATCKRIRNRCQWRPCPSQRSIFSNYFGSFF